MRSIAWFLRIPKLPLQSIHGISMRPMRSVAKAVRCFYRSDCGDPILLLGNISDIMPSMDAEIVDSMGGSVSYQPFLCRSMTVLCLPLPGFFDFTPVS